MQSGLQRQRHACYRAARSACCGATEHPLEPAAAFSAKGRSAVEFDFRRSRRADQRGAAAPASARRSPCPCPCPCPWRRLRAEGAVSECVARKLSAHPKKTKHEKDDDDGTDKPDDSVHEGFPFRARGAKRGRPAHIDLIPPQPIQAFSGACSVRCRTVPAGGPRRKVIRPGPPRAAGVHRLRSAVP